MLQKIIDFILAIFGGIKSTSTNRPTPSPKGKQSHPKPKPTTTPPPPVEKPKVAEYVNFAIPTSTLSLGCYDANVNPSVVEHHLKVYHQNMSGIPNDIKFKKFRNGDLLNWVSPKKVDGDAVLNLQKFLQQIGILPPHSKPDGVFGYATQAAVRLFQEYVRTIEGETSIGSPDGIIGKNGWSHIKRWMDGKKTAEAWSRNKPSLEYNKWLGLLSKAQSHYQNKSHRILDKVNEKVRQIGTNKVDTLQTSDWKTDSSQIHLIGIRRKEEDSDGLRQNDDVFVLLISGMVFKFWGSTDPNHKAKSRKDEAFLVEGQHKFRFGWHNRSEANQNKVYQGLNPYTFGVLVFRDRDNDDKLTDADIQAGGIDNTPNNTINIHWTGSGKGASGTWSAGCQVFAGQNYINNKGDLIDCSKFAAIGSKDLKASASKTKGAYNMFTDLVLLYRPEGVEHLYYTLGRDETFDHKFVVDLAGMDMLSDTLKVFKLPGTA